MKLDTSPNSITNTLQNRHHGFKKKNHLSPRSGWDGESPSHEIGTLLTILLFSEETVNILIATHDLASLLLLILFFQHTSRK